MKFHIVYWENLTEEQKEFVKRVYLEGNPADYKYAVGEDEKNIDRYSRYH